MGSRGQLETAHFAELVRRYGEAPAAYYRRVGPCPNPHRKVVSGFTPDPDCALCGGVGEVFESVSLAEVIATSPAAGKLVLLNAVTSKQRQPVEKVLGELQCTYLPTDYEMGDGDRVLLSSRDAWTSESGVRDPGGKGAAGDLLRRWPVLEIGAVWGQSGAVDAGYYGVDSTGRKIEFTAGSGVDAGEQYTVRYRYRPQWVVVESSHLRRIEATNGDRFPNRCLLRMWQGLNTDFTAAQSG